MSGHVFVDESKARDYLLVAAVVYRAGTAYVTEVERRRSCLTALVRDAARDARTHVCLERDESLVSRDRQNLIEATRRFGCTDTLAYRHEAAVSEPLLAVPDAIAWAWAKGGQWRGRCPDVVVVDV